LRKKALKYSVFGADEAIEGDAVTVYILRRFHLVSNGFCTVVQNVLLPTFPSEVVAISRLLAANNCVLTAVTPDE